MNLLNFGIDPDYILDKKKLNFQSSLFQCIFKDFGFLVDATSKVMSRLFYVGRSWPKEGVIHLVKILHTIESQFFGNGSSLCNCFLLLEISLRDFSRRVCSFVNIEA